MRQAALVNDLNRAWGTRSLPYCAKIDAGSGYFGVVVIHFDPNLCQRNTSSWLVALVLTFAGSIGIAADADPRLSPDNLEKDGVAIGNIVLDKQNVFDLTNPEEDRRLYRLANRWHIVTRDSVIKQQLLFKRGQPYSKRLVEETERILRRNSFLYDASIEAVAREDGVADLRVRTRDVWTLMPGFSISRSGGENKTRGSLSDRNLLGTGVTLRVSYEDNVDRSSTAFQYFDQNLGRTWTSLFAEIAENSDGDTRTLRIERPFYALDSRWSAGANYYDDTRDVAFYVLGDEAAGYSMRSDVQSIFAGWSSGLKNGWVRRWIAGIARDERRFSERRQQPFATPLPTLLPTDRSLIYPYIGFEFLEDRFKSTSNRDQIGRTEDFYLGTRVSGTLGFAAEGFGSDRESWIYTLDASRGFGNIDKKAVLLSAGVSGRVDNGRTANRRVSVNARYYNQITSKRLFFMTLDMSHGESLDLDNLADLGGDTGLRGYPLRYQAGDSRFLFRVEERYFTDWYPFRLARVGGAVFADVGRTWGDDALGNRPVGWLTDLGIGIRLAPTRASGRDVIHIDIAFPLNGDSSIDDVQVLLQSKRSF